MADPIQITVKGGREIDAKLRDLGSKIAGRLGNNATRAGARVLAASAKTHVPVRTGKLKASIRVVDDQELRKSGGSARAAYATAGGKGARHAHLVELGTVHSAAKSFLRKALDEQGQAAVDRMSENLWRAIERELDKRAAASEEGE